MAATVYVDVWCDVCYDWTHGDSKTIRGARWNAKHRYGWVYRKIDGRMMDLCKECAEAYVDATAESTTVLAADAEK